MNCQPSEVCDGRDNDCDGIVDNGFACVMGAPDGGSCTYANTATSCTAPGTMTCKSDCSGYACAAPPEVCNGIDDNCNGQIDEGLTVGGAWQVTNAGDGGPSAQSPSIAALPSGAVAVGTYSRMPIPSKVWFQRLDAQMKPTGPMIGVYASSNPQTSPVVVSTTSGFAVGWIEQSLVWLSRFDASGTPQGAPVLMSNSNMPAIAVSLSGYAAPGSDKVHLVWEDHRSGSPAVYYNWSTSSASGQETEVNTGQPPVHHPAVAANPGAATIGIAYEYQLTGSPTQIDLLVLDDSQLTEVSRAQVSGSNAAVAPTLAPSGSGYAVAWQDNVGSPNSANPSDIAIRMPGSALVQYISNANGDSEAPHLTAGPAGWFAIAWQDDRSGAWVIHMARLDGTGVIQAELSMTSSTTPQVAPWVAYTGASFAVTWLGDASPSHVYAQLLCP